MQRNISRRSALSSIAAGSLLLSAGTRSGAAFGFASPEGTFPQTGYDGANTARTPYTGPRGTLFTCWDVTLPSVYSPPLVTTGGVIALVSGDGETEIRALDRRTGAARWTHGVGDYVVQSVLGANDEYAFTATILEPRVRAVSLDDGSTAWETTVDDMSGGFIMGPRVNDGRVYLRSRDESHIHAFDASSGEQVESFEHQYSRFAVDGDTLVGSMSAPHLEQSGVAFVDVDDPTVRSVYETAGRPGRPTIGEDTVYVGTSRNQVHAIDKATGQTRWSRPVGNWAVSLTLAGDVLIARTSDGLLGLDSADGNLKWQLIGQTTRTIATDERFYVPTEDRIGVGDLAEANEQISYTVDPISESINYLTMVDKGLYAASLSGTVAMIGEFEAGTL